MIRIQAFKSTTDFYRTDSSKAIRRLLQPVFSLLRSLGFLNLENSECFYPIGMFTLHAYLCYFFSWLFVHTEKNSLWYSFTLLEHCLASASTIDMMWIRKSKLNDLLTMLSQVQTPNSIASTKKWMKGSLILIAVYGTSSVIIGYMLLSFYPLQVYYDIYFYGLRVEKWYNFLKYILPAVNIFTAQLMVFQPIYFYIVLYSVLCRNIYTVVNDYNRGIKTVRIRNVSAVKLLQMQHFRLTVCVQQMDDLFSPVMFIWYSVTCVYVCNEISLLLDKGEDPFINETFIAFTLFKLLPSVCFLLVLSLLAANVKEVFLCTVDCVRRLSLALPTREEDCLLQVELLQSQSIKLCPALTIWNFVVVSRRLILACFSFFVTYTIIVLQLNPRATKKFRSG
ncbi:uncharacterized protein LOC111633548 [Centruroides sculpturatus]|uniref:uncharacterized protein LOC111633548 n=1 Tax=Centruroides sculpturatus TaxID=218467 RepID=UPI000C6CEC3E|nr:uncharacterized protein LOC111633548 [Centruroides sculpturatus]